MTLPAPTYDLVLLLDPAADDDTRAKLVADTRASIEAQGEFLRHDEWGERALTYPIDKKTSARYHLLQFHVSSTDLLSSLDRTLRLADEVLRFRIIKLAPGVGAPPADMAAGAAARAPQPDGAPASEAALPSEPASADAPAADAPAAEAPAAEADASEGSVPEAPADEATAPEAPAAETDAEVAVGEPS
jgi:small subunit ribosomal protein S6